MFKQWGHETYKKIIDINHNEKVQMSSKSSRVNISHNSSKNKKDYQLTTEVTITKVIKSIKVIKRVIVKVEVLSIIEKTTY